MSEPTPVVRFDALEEMPEIRPFPQTASRIIAASNDPDIKAEELCEFIQCDPGIGLKIIRVANSSAYGLSGEVRTLQHAVVVLGFKALSNLAVSVAAGDVFAAGNDVKEARQALWEHSMGCAAVASMLAGHVTGIKSEEAFLAGIVHDVGKLMFLDLGAEAYCEATANSSAHDVIATEQSLFGTDHQELGMRCADDWGLPFEIADAIGAHHSVYEENSNPDLVNLVGFADSLAWSWGIGSKATDVDIERVLRHANLSFDEEALKPLADEAHEHYEALQSAFSS